MKTTHLPQELITQILSILPIKPLVRFQCVSKSWFALIINDSHFINLHLSRSKERILILASSEPLDYLIVNLSNEDRFGEAVKIQHPLHHSESNRIVDSCNGLVCINNYNDETVIWNPLIRKYKKLPSKPREELSHDHFAFGHDRVNDDYKVLRLVEFYRRDGRRKYSLEVYSLREHSWRMVEEEWPIVELSHFCYTCRAIFSNGAFHWMVTLVADLKKVHVAFDLSTEKFRVHEFPVNSSINLRVFLVDLGGWLCAVFQDLCEVWVMKEYGIVSSWTLLYAMERAFTNYPPLVFSRDGEEVFTGELIESHLMELYWYDIKKKTRRIVEIENIPVDLILPYFCVGSLLLLDADNDKE
ncbi:F-box protein CPR1-like [Corylus avellana]|uniref:F-box protein CPR1-like n=1 Tax=Corylus avellana TaxID=13451 RepID=UPI00286BEC3A|nr:F-box protein CPR1-like [Corylus avellana]